MNAVDHRRPAALAEPHASLAFIAETYEWDWATADGAKVLSVLDPYQHLTVFYGHIHQENHRTTGHINHHSAKSLMFPLPAPMSVPIEPPI